MYMYMVFFKDMQAIIAIPDNNHACMEVVYFGP